MTTTFAGTGLQLHLESRVNNLPSWNYRKIRQASSEHEKKTSLHCHWYPTACNNCLPTVRPIKCWRKSPFLSACLPFSLSLPPTPIDKIMADSVALLRHEKHLWVWCSSHNMPNLKFWHLPSIIDTVEPTFSNT